MNVAAGAPCERWIDYSHGRPEIERAAVDEAAKHLFGCCTNGCTGAVVIGWTGSDKPLTWG